MTWLLITAVAGSALVIGSVGAVLAWGLGRVAAETDQADLVAWTNWRLGSGVGGTLQ